MPGTTLPASIEVLDLHSDSPHVAHPETAPRGDLPLR